MELIRRHRIVLLIIFGLIPFLHVSTFAKDRGTVLYEESLSLYRNISVNPDKAKDKEIWETIAQAFSSVYETYPNSNKAPNSLFLAGKMYEEIGNRFNSNSDYRKAIYTSRQFVETFPLSNLTDDAQIRIARIYEKMGDKKQAYIEYTRIIEDLPQDDMANAANKKRKELARYKPTEKEKKKYRYPDTGKPKITKIRHW